MQAWLETELIKTRRAFSIMDQNSCSGSVMEYLSYSQKCLVLQKLRKQTLGRLFEQVGLEIPVRNTRLKKEQWKTVMRHARYAWLDSTLYCDFVTDSRKRLSGVRIIV